MPGRCWKDPLARVGMCTKASEGMVRLEAPERAERVVLPYRAWRVADVVRNQETTWGRDQLSVAGVLARERETSLKRGGGTELDGRGGLETHSRVDVARHVDLVAVAVVLLIRFSASAVEEP